MDARRIRTIMADSRREVVKLQVVLNNLKIFSIYFFQQKFNIDYNESNPVTIFPDPPLKGLLLDQNGE